MRDIFDNAILCNKCNKPMHDDFICKNGFNLRIKKCDQCKEKIVHPVDSKEYEEFIELKKKDYEVKMRMVGNSYAVSIPREIVDFMEEHERMINNMVRLNFEDFGRLSLAFNTNENTEDSHVVSSKEVKIMRNGKPFLHAKKFTDSKHPERNKTQVLRDKTQAFKKDLEEEEE